MVERLRARSPEDKEERMHARTARKEYRFWLRRAARNYFKARWAIGSPGNGMANHARVGTLLDDLDYQLSKLRRLEIHSRHIAPEKTSAPKRVGIAIAVRRRLDEGVDTLEARINKR